MEALTAEARTFRYEKPEIERGKKVLRLARTDRMIGLVHVVREGGENNLHSHPHQDGFYFVLKGKVRFYGQGDTLIGELGPFEGIVIPRGTAYWFESAGKEALELLSVESFDIPIKTDKELIEDRINHRPPQRALKWESDVS
jgi:mannose-6-phosphate isomerase-like protein (cupin superfamily)